MGSFIISLSFEKINNLNVTIKKLKNHEIFHVFIKKFDELEENEVKNELLENGIFLLNTNDESINVYSITEDISIYFDSISKKLNKLIEKKDYFINLPIENYAEIDRLVLETKMLFSLNGLTLVKDNNLGYNIWKK